MATAQPAFTKPLGSDDATPDTLAEQIHPLLVQLRRIHESHIRHRQWQREFETILVRIVEELNKICTTALRGTCIALPGQLQPNKNDACQLNIQQPCQYNVAAESTAPDPAHKVEENAIAAVRSAVDTLASDGLLSHDASVQLVERVPPSCVRLAFTANTFALLSFPVVCLLHEAPWVTAAFMLLHEGFCAFPDTVRDPRALAACQTLQYALHALLVNGEALNQLERQGIPSSAVQQLLDYITTSQISISV